MPPFLSLVGNNHRRGSYPLQRSRWSHRLGVSPVSGIKSNRLRPDLVIVLRAERVVRNQVFFREVNERICSAARRFVAAADVASVHFQFLCECARRGCVERIAMSAAEYELVRQDPLTFAVAPGHQIPSIEQLVAQNERFACVRKFHPEPSKTAREHDPRRQSEIVERPPADA